MIDEMVISPKAEQSEDDRKKVTDIRQSSMPSPSLRLPKMPQCKGWSLGRPYHDWHGRRGVDGYCFFVSTHEALHCAYIKHSSAQRRAQSWRSDDSSSCLDGSSLQWVRQDTHSTLGPLRLEAVGGSTAPALHTRHSREHHKVCQQTSRPDYLWPAVWSNMSKLSTKEKQHWAIRIAEARHCSQIGEFITSIRICPRHEKMRAKSWKLHLDAEMPCKNVTGRGETSCVKSDTRRTRNACIIEASGSTRSRIGKNQRRDHRDLIAERGFNSLSHYNRVHRPSPIHLAIKILNAKAAVDREWDELEQLPAWQATKVAVIEKAQKEAKDSSCL